MHRIAKTVRLLRQPVTARALVKHHVGAAIEHLPALSGLQLRSVVDVGANKGQFSLLVRSLFPQAQIFAFEPLPDAARLYRTVFEGDPRVELFSCALGNATKCAELHISAKADSSSLLPIGKLQSTIFAGTQEVGTLQVQVKRLADVLPAKALVAPALLKLDVQGYELSALQGAEPLLCHFAWVYCECSFMPLYEGQPLAHDVLAWLRDRGFVLQGVYTVSYDRDGNTVQADLLLGRRES